MGKGVTLSEEKVNHSKNLGTALSGSFSISKYDHPHGMINLMKNIARLCRFLSVKVVTQACTL